MLDAPVSGGVTGAEAGSLTFMCGGSPEVFARAKPILDVMGKNIFLAGGPGAGQAAKACNNMLLAINMIGISEAFNLADALGLERKTLFDIVGTASGGSWALANYCPVPELVPTTPANKDFNPGFTGAMMLKDLKLGQDAAQSLDVTSPLGAAATMLFSMYCNEGYDADDFKADATDMWEVTTSDVLRELENDLFGEALDPQDERCLQYAVKYLSGLTLYG